MAQRQFALKRRLIGRPRSSAELGDTLLSKRLALPIFASDPLSSVAYATEAALVVLIAASATALVLPISIAIAAVLAIVVLSYMQTFRRTRRAAAPTSSRGRTSASMPSLVAAAALLTDYVLTVAVSVAAGVLALTSQRPPLRVTRSGSRSASSSLLTLVNLRGVRESGLLFAIPTYAFVAAMYAMVATGVGKCAVGSCPQAHAPHPIAAGAGVVGVFVLLQAFASGAAALTGVEAISNGVSAFRPPPGEERGENAPGDGRDRDLAVHRRLVPRRRDARAAEQQRLADLRDRALGLPVVVSLIPMYFAVQALTFAILVLAANTSYQGFPRLAAVLARDRFFPRQFVNLGDRLVYSNGIIVLAGIASLLIWVFHANVISLHPPLRDRRLHRLHAVAGRNGAVLAATPEPGWRAARLINGIGGGRDRDRRRCS